jgi:phenylpropionate dioxygenase-like ring-hydroxylating dioxygenase large terminal subunit
MDAPSYQTDAVGDLVRPDRVHRRVYADPHIFSLEMERIFGQAWIFVGHASQVPNPGDYVTTRIGLQPVIVVRHSDDTIHVLLNRCSHRGALVCQDEKGSVKRFRCLYHNWFFETDGTLHALPMKSGYADFETRSADFDLRRVPRVANYRGFIFASLAAEGTDFAVALGPMKSSLDDIVDRAPDGEIEFAGGVLRQVSSSNWKLIIENANDMVHAGALHESANDAALATSTEGYDPEFGQHRVAAMRSNASPLAKMDESGTAGYPWGHSFIGGLPRAPRGGAVFAEYRRRMVARHGEARTNEILSVTRHLNLIYPNLLTNGFYSMIKVILPVAVDRTEVLAFPIRLKGAPEEMFHTTINMVNNTGSTAGLAMADDLEMYQRCQLGYAAESVEWIDLGRGYGLERRDDTGALRATGTSELPMRSQFNAWRRYMTGDI